MSRPDIWRLINSPEFAGFKKRSPQDAAKVMAEWEGQRRPNPRSGYGIGMVNLIRANPKPAPPPAATGFPLPTALWVQSDSEDLAKAKAAGLKSCLFQMGGDDWTVLRSRALNLGMPYGYWFHVRTIADLDKLLLWCKSLHSALCGINVEAELETTLTPKVIRQRIDASGYPLERCCVIAYGWVQNNVRVTDADLGTLTWLLEMFPQDAPALMVPHEKLGVCFEHAFVLGIKNPRQLMGIYGAGQPSWYAGSIKVDRSVYPANAIRDEWSRWL